jgi:predicted ATPase
LTSLDREAERRLVSDLVGEGTLPDELAAVLLARAEGNPFYLRELLRSLRDTGSIVEAEGRWTFDPHVLVEVPDTVERVVLARIDRLPPRDRDLLNAAAVIGREFELPLLARTAGTDLSPDSLANLTRLGLFEGAAGNEYRFSHPLIQETAYFSMLRRGRAELHGRAAAAIEEVIEDGSDAHHAVLARHHSAAGHVNDAVRYHRLAALASQRVVAMEEALNQLDLAIAAAGSLDDESARAQLPELHLLRGQARGRASDYVGGTDDLGRALEGARAIGDQQVEMQALDDLGWLIRAHSYEQAIDHHQQALRIAEEVGDLPTQVTALSRMSMIYLNQLRLNEGMDLAQRALEISRASGQYELLGTALDCRKLAALQLGHLELLEQTVAEIIAVQERANDLYLLQWAYLESATAPLARGELGKAREQIDAATEINARFVSERIAHAMVLEASSWIDRAAGDPRAAIAAMHAAVDTLGDEASPEFAAWLAASLGSHLIEQGDTDEAIAILESALEHAEAVKSPNRALRAVSHLAWARSLVGDVVGSRNALTQAEQVMATITAPPGSVFLDGYRSYLAVARTYLALGEPGRAQDLLTPLVAAAREHGWRDAEQGASELLDATEEISRSGVPARPDQAP